MQIRSLIFVCLLSIASFLPAFANEQKIIKDLKEGGKLILIRHSDAPGTGDPAHFNLNDCKTQRNLSAEGIEQAKRLGEFFRKNNISVEKVYSSEYCRCKDTARNAFKDAEFIARVSCAIFLLCLLYYCFYLLLSEDLTVVRNYTIKIY